MKKNIKIKILNPLIKPFITTNYSTDGSAGLDLRACLIKPVNLKSNETKLIPTGIAIHIADNTLAGIIIPRSGLGHQYGLVMGNLIGLIDSDYQGELMISAWNRSKTNFRIFLGDRIAQIVFIKIVQAQFHYVRHFESTKRNCNGFGHTGIK
uniref:dUTP diphosphatase n=1 Tax=Candidatus Aschnera chinzeii TaxID=1485666 RepID=A0AAT9G524_9ENTR|nr:MAG: dUTP diphosphatase [Candidatus Aschnera chinzeii]